MPKAREHRDKLLLNCIILWAETAKEHPREADGQIKRILAAALELSRSRDMNDTRRKTLQSTLLESAVIPGGSDENSVTWVGTRLFINEEFEGGELAKRLFW